MDFFTPSQIHPILKKKCKKSRFQKFCILHFQWTFSTFQSPPILKKKCKKLSFQKFCILYFQAFPMDRFNKFGKKIIIFIFNTYIFVQNRLVEFLVSDSTNFNNPLTIKILILYFFSKNGYGLVFW